MMNSIELQPHHCGLSVADLEESIKLYCEILGFRLAKRDSMGNIQVAFLKTGDFYLELFCTPGSRQSEEIKSGVGQDLGIQGTKHIAFQVKDTKKLAEYFKSHGVKMVMPGRLPEGGGPPPGAECVFITDPSGIMLEFTPFNMIQE